jgi:hypothetical protein
MGAVVVITKSDLSICIGTAVFPTKAAAERHIRALLWRWPPMTALSGDDLELVQALIQMHPNRSLIIDCGIRSIYSQPVPFHENDQRRFLVKRTDSSIRDFSWRNALSPKPAKGKLASILRHLIIDQKDNFKAANFRGICEIETCGKPVKKGDCHVDHASPATFDRLMQGWLRSLFLTPDDVAIVRRKGYEEHSVLEDPDLAESWVEYHRINARLRCVCSDCNLSALR